MGTDVLMLANVFFFASVFLPFLIPVRTLRTSFSWNFDEHIHKSSLKSLGSPRSIEGRGVEESNMRRLFHALGIEEWN